MIKFSELIIDRHGVVDSELSTLLESYSTGRYEVVNQLIELLNNLVNNANINNRGYHDNDDISICAIAIIDSKYRLGCYQECLDLIDNYCLNNYYHCRKVLPELLRGWCFLVLSKHGQAESIARKFLQSKEYHDNPEVIASFLFLLGKTCYALKKYNDAKQHYNDALALYRYAGSSTHSCTVLTALGLIEKEVGRLSKSIEYYDKAYSLVDFNKYSDRAADITLNKAISLLKHGRIEDALVAVNSLSKNQLLPPLMMVKHLIIKARIQLHCNFIEESYNTIISALPIFSMNQYLREEVLCLETCGDIEVQRTNYNIAEMYYSRAEQIAKLIDNSSDLVGGILLRYTSLYNAVGNYPQALVAGKQAQVILERVNIGFELGSLFRALSISYLGLNNFPVAYKYVLKSIARYVNHEAMLELASSHLTAADICCNWHNYYQQYTNSDEAYASLVIESYNMVAFDNRTLYEASWYHALEAHSLYSLYGSKDDLNKVEIVLDRIRSMSNVSSMKTIGLASFSTVSNPVTLMSYSQPMKSLLSAIEIAIGSEEPVLLTGETGTGKELVARIIHEQGTKSRAPFIPVNCAAIPEQLFEREFFGNVKGAYTGADVSIPGVAEQADGGTLFLDEIGEMPLLLQAKLLRILQDGTYHRLGDPQMRTVDLRIIAATNADINKMVNDKSFRPDFYYRLKTLEIHMPPLRERPEDIEPLMALFIQKILGDKFSPRDIFSKELMSLYYKYPWPGNVRELESITRRLALYAKFNEKVTVEMLPKHMQQYINKKPQSQSVLHLSAYLENAERERILQSLVSSGGNRSDAARLLGISRKVMYGKMKRLGIKFPI
jgi:DNA-binding NtrC family response regulator/tetratricopeptide (TPR) repeat protein